MLPGIILDEAARFNIEKSSRGYPRELLIGGLLVSLDSQLELRGLNVGCVICGGDIQVYGVALAIEKS